MLIQCTKKLLDELEQKPGPCRLSSGGETIHLHEFYLYEKDWDNPVLNLVSDEEILVNSHPVEPMKMKHEKGIKLSEYIPAFDKLKYVYDFGDYWEHYIEVEKIIHDYDANYPVCFDGEGKAPPEDVGGRGGYLMGPVSRL